MHEFTTAHVYRKCFFIIMFHLSYSQTVVEEHRGAVPSRGWCSLRGNTLHFDRHWVCRSKLNKVKQRNQLHLSRCLLDMKWSIKICALFPVTQSFATLSFFIFSSICLLLMLQSFFDWYGCCGCNGIYDASLQQHLRWSRWVLPILPPSRLRSDQNKRVSDRGRPYPTSCETRPYVIFRPL